MVSIFAIHIVRALEGRVRTRGLTDSIAMDITITIAIALTLTVALIWLDHS